MRSWHAFCFGLFQVCVKLDLSRLLQLHRHDCIFFLEPSQQLHDIMKSANVMRLILAKLLSQHHVCQRFFFIIIVLFCRLIVDLTMTRVCNITLSFNETTAG